MSALNLNKLIFHRPQANFGAVFDYGPPIRRRMHVVEVIAGMRFSVEYAARHDGLRVNSVGASDVESDGIEGREHSHVRYDGDVVFAMTIAERRYVSHEGDVESGSILNDGEGVFAYLLIEDLIFRRTRDKRRPSGIVRRTVRSRRTCSYQSAPYAFRQKR